MGSRFDKVVLSTWFTHAAIAVSLRISAMKRFLSNKESSRKKIERREKNLVPENTGYIMNCPDDQNHNTFLQLKIYYLPTSWVGLHDSAQASTNFGIGFLVHGRPQTVLL